MSFRSIEDLSRGLKPSHRTIVVLLKSMVIRVVCAQTVGKYSVKYNRLPKNRIGKLTIFAAMYPTSKIQFKHAPTTRINV